MKNSTLLIRSALVIVLLAGTAHFATRASQKASTNQKTTVSDTSSSEEKIIDATSFENSIDDFLSGTWIVNYQSSEFKGAIVYEIKQVGTKYAAYTLKYQDENGYSEKAPYEKALEIASFSDTNGKGVYKIEYEGELYNVDCYIEKIDNHSFKLTYDYYGYSDVETWKKL